MYSKDFLAKEENYYVNVQSLNEHIKSYYDNN